MSTAHEARHALQTLRITDVTHTISQSENIDELVLTMEDGSKVVISSGTIPGYRANMTRLILELVK